MTGFPDVLSELKQTHPDLFEEEARREPDPDDLVVDITGITVREPKDSHQPGDVDRPARPSKTLT